MSFLPVSKKDMDDMGWDQLDFLFVSGDAYVDHPSFGHAIITRVLENKGYRVGIIAQPKRNELEDFAKLGRPKYAVLISSGVVDSMVNNYTAAKKNRSSDKYSPGGLAGLRPDRAIIVYVNKIRQVFKNIPVILGGTEASLRRFAHYDYWDNRVRRSILLDSKADILVYGMGEKPIIEIADRLSKGEKISSIKNVRGTAYISNLLLENKDDFILLDSYETASTDVVKYAKSFKIQYFEQDPFYGKTMIQPHGDRYVVQNPPAFPLTTSDLDRIYALPYEREYHPMYKELGGIPAIEEVKFSIISHRGCYGGCSFCALNFHQGRIIQNRSQASIINEAKKFVWHPEFKGYIHDVGGPTANFRMAACKRQENNKNNENGSSVHCSRQCLYPTPCKNLIVDHSEYLELLRKLRNIPGIKKVFIRSGIRFDYLMLDKNDEFFIELCEHHVSGQLKVAPEHVAKKVLNCMGKCEKEIYIAFVKKFYNINAKIRKEQYIVPYLMSGHPGSDLKSAIELAEYLRDTNYTPEQVQDFYPTPGTLSTCMFYTGIDPRDMKKVHVPKSTKEKAMQRALLQYKRTENYNLVFEALELAGRKDLIGYDKKCLIRPRQKIRRVVENVKNKKQKITSVKKKISKY